MSRSWQNSMVMGLDSFLLEGLPDGYNLSSDARAHLIQTPRRVVQYLEDATSGYKVDIRGLLSVAFAQGHYDEMVHVRGNDVRSLCKHHMLPIIGKAHFAYVPNGKIVGLSKIPRMIDALSRRLQVQEDLTEEIVSQFQGIVQPAGCAVSVRAFHCCAWIRGVEEPVVMDTVALRGCFKKDAQARQEFLMSIDVGERVFP